MDIEVVSALVGTLVGVTATVAMAWINQKTLTHRELIRDEMRMRQTLYGEFITECARLLIDAFQHTLEKPDTFVPVYTLINRIRVCATQPVLTEAEHSAAHHRTVPLEQPVSAGAASARAFGRGGCTQGVRRGLPGGAQVDTGATLARCSGARRSRDAHSIATECRRFPDHSPVAASYAESRKQSNRPRTVRGRTITDPPTLPRDSKCRRIHNDQSAPTTSAGAWGLRYPGLIMGGNGEECRSSPACGASSPMPTWCVHEGAGPGRVWGVPWRDVLGGDDAPRADPHGALVRRRTQDFDGYTLFFISQFDGTLEKYFDDFVLNGKKNLEAIWGNCVGCPTGPDVTARDIVQYIARGQIKTLACYDAVPSLSISQIYKAADWYEKTQKFQRAVAKATATSRRRSTRSSGAGRAVRARAERRQHRHGRRPPVAVRGRGRARRGVKQGCARAGLGCGRQRDHEHCELRGGA